MMSGRSDYFIPRDDVGSVVQSDRENPRILLARTTNFKEIRLALRRFSLRGGPELRR